MDQPGRRMTLSRSQIPAPAAADPQLQPPGHRGPGRGNAWRLAQMRRAQAQRTAREAGPTDIAEAGPTTTGSVTTGPTTTSTGPTTTSTGPTTTSTGPTTTSTGPTTTSTGPTTTSTGPTTTSTGPTTTDPNAAANDLPAWARKPVVTAKLLKADATGADVGALQKAIGLPVTGIYDAATVEGVKAWQKAHNLGDDGIAGRKTLTALGLVDDLRSRYHDNEEFVPEYRATAYSESDEHRKATDPYAVGSITHPNQGDDDGGKTYGTYQFESYVYADGTQKKGSVDSSTVMRFVNNTDNPYSAQLKKVVADHGVASAEFDALWGQLSKDENKAFGKAQEAFLKSEYAPKVKAFFDKANVPEAIRADPDLYDVTMGTVNQYGGLADHISDAVAEAQKASKTPLTAKQIGHIMQETKAGHVTDWFRSSPNAWAGIRDRVSREGKLFAE